MFEESIQIPNTQFSDFISPRIKIAIKEVHPKQVVPDTDFRGQ